MRSLCTKSKMEDVGLMSPLGVDVPRRVWVTGGKVFTSDQTTDQIANRSLRVRRHQPEAKNAALVYRDDASRMILNVFVSLNSRWLAGDGPRPRLAGLSERIGSRGEGEGSLLNASLGIADSYV